MVVQAAADLGWLLYCNLVNPVPNFPPRLWDNQQVPLRNLHTLSLSYIYQSIIVRNKGAFILS